MPDPSSYTNPDRITGTLSVYDDEDDTGTYDHLIGHLKIDGEGYLDIVAAEPARAVFLGALVQRLNSKPALAWIANTPGEELDEYVTQCASIKRGDEGFLQALCDYVETYYAVRLV